MGLFGAIKNKLTDTITLNDSQKGLLTRYKLKNDSLKINQEVVVNEDFEAVTCYYDQVCDVLTPGKYKFNDVHMPKLYKNVKAKKTKKGFVPPKSLPADLYYISKTMFGGLTFKTPYRFKMRNGAKLIKVKVAGEFNITVVDSYKFLNSMLMDYSTINADQAKKEIGAYVAYAILKYSQKNIHSANEFSGNDATLIEQLSQVIEKELKSIGLTMSDFKITEIIPPVDAENIEPVKKTDKTLDDIFNTIYNGEKKAEEETEKKETSEVFVGQKTNSGEAQMSTASVINLGFGPSGLSATTQPKTEERNSTVDEYEKASKSFNDDLMAKRQQNLVFLNGRGEQKPQATDQKKEETKKEDIMLGRNTIGTIDALGKVDIADDFVQANRKVELEALKKSLEEPEKEIKRQKVLKEGQEAKVEKTCRSCGAKYTIKDKFCPKCGKSTLSVRYCKACGEPNDDTALLCKTCGSRL